MLKYLKRGTKENTYLKSKINELEKSENVCKEMLSFLKNNTSKIVIDKDIKNSYYVFLNDTIYISDNERIKNGYERICTIAHECIHSVQNKKLQILNFLLSNIELLFFIISIILIICRVTPNTILFYYGIFTVLSFIPRIILESGAIFKSVILAKEYLKNKLSIDDTHLICNIYKLQIKLYLPLFIISLTYGKVLRFAILYLISKVI